MKIKNNMTCSSFNYSKDLEEQRQLFIDCFPENLGTKVIEDEHYLWKFQSYPHTPKSFEYIAQINNEMVGYYAALPYQYKIGDSTMNVGMVCDVMTSSKYRGQGIFTKLGRYSLEAMGLSGVPFTLGYPIRKEVLPGHLKVGWEVAFKQPLYMKFLSSSSLMKAKGKPFFAHFLNPFISLYASIMTRRNSKGITIQVYNQITDVVGYEELVKEWSKNIPNALNKSLEFAKWRYGAPGKTYQFIGAYNKDNKLIGFASIREIIKESVPSLGILDFIAIDKKCLNNIHNKITDIARSLHKEAIMTMMSPTSARMYRMIKNGFIRSPFIFNVIINKLDSNIDDSLLFNERRWHLMFIDSDDL